MLALKSQQKLEEEENARKVDALLQELFPDRYLTKKVKGKSIKKAPKSLVGLRSNRLSALFLHVNDRLD